MIKLLFIISSLALLLQLDFKPGVYHFSNDHIEEEIHLNPDKSFTYTFRGHILNYELEGNWTLTNDSLILNSIPQRDRMLVREHRKGASDKYCFNVSNKKGASIHYKIHLLDFEGNVVTLEDQWRRTKIKPSFRVRAFSIEDSKGLKSPYYIIEGGSSNSFDISFESKRVFEGEVWLIHDDKLMPKLISGELAQYRLGYVRSL
ncbi:MAG: hypothetical protein AAFZ63_29020 [Bacteroidota bacterium]